MSDTTINVTFVESETISVTFPSTLTIDAIGGGGGGGGSGTVTSVNASGGTTGLSFSGGPVTSSGTLTMAGTLEIANGGTGQTTASAALGALGGVPSTRQVTAGTGLTGGGDLSDNRIFDVTYGTSGSTACVGNDSRLSDARTPTSHSHPQSEITGLVSALSAKAPIASPSFTGSPTVPDDAYDATAWNGNSGIPTKNAVRDKIESLSAGGSSYYLLKFQSTIATSPADGATLYVASTNIRSSYTDSEIEVPHDGTVTAYWVRVAVTSTVGTTEDVNYYLRLNNTTDFGNMVDDWDGYSHVRSGTLSQAVVSGDKLAVKIVCPTWATNPLSVYVSGWIKIEV